MLTKATSSVCTCLGEGCTQFGRFRHSDFVHVGHRCHEAVNQSHNEVTVNGRKMKN
jgi:hypothetical protein